MRYVSMCVQPLKARVKNGRLTLDEPTDLPDGYVVYLQRVTVLDTVVEDDRDNDDRAALHAELEASIEDADRDETESFTELIAKLRATK